MVFARLPRKAPAPQVHEEDEKSNRKRSDVYFSLGASSDAADFASATRMRNGGIGFGANIGELEIGVRSAFIQCESAAKKARNEELDIVIDGIPSSPRADADAETAESLRAKLAIAQSRVEALETSEAAARRKLEISRGLVSDLYRCLRKYHASYDRIMEGQTAPLKWRR